MKEKRAIHEEDQHVIIGKVKDTYGLRGELRVEPYLEGKHWRKLKRVFLKRKGGDYVPFPLEFVKSHGKDIILRFEGYSHISQVEGFKGAKIFLPKKELPKRGKDEYYYFELYGLDVYTEGGKFMGKVTGVWEQKPYDLLEIEEGKLYIPFVGALVKKVDLKKGRVIVDEALSQI
ncbi:MAG: ribosome maturation factor RimM [Aquificaceae bacterium]